MIKIDEENSEQISILEGSAEFDSNGYKIVSGDDAKIDFHNIINLKKYAFSVDDLTNVKETNAALSGKIINSSKYLNTDDVDNINVSITFDEIKLTSFSLDYTYNNSRVKTNYSF